MKYDITFSFASEQKEIVEEFKNELQRLGLKVFVDEEHPELFVFKHVPDVLKQIYNDENTVMLIFLSEDYVRKDFTAYEGHIASDRLISRKKIEIIRVDDAELPWLPCSCHYFDIRKNETSYICQAICQAIVGEADRNLSQLFRCINDNLVLEKDSIIPKYSSETCYIYWITAHKNTNLRIILLSEENSILFFSDILCADMSIPFAEINLKDNIYILYNMGFFENGKAMQKYVSEEKLLEHVVSRIKMLWRKYD